MKNINSKKSKKLNKIFTLVVFAIALISGSVYGVYNIVKAEDEIKFEKNVEVDTDGTYKVSLDITGSADTTTTESKANVLIVYDVSGSMKGHLPYQYGSYGHTSTYQSEGWVQLYKYSNYRYVAITDDEKYTGTVYSDRYGTVYTGDRFYKYSRAEKAEATVYDFADALLSHNTTSPNSVQMALVTFSSVGSQVRFGSGSNASYWTSNTTQFLSNFAENPTSYSYVQQEYDGLTNWESALKKAVSTLGSADSDPTFVVFVTDGAPNLRDLGDNHRYINSDKISNYSAYDYAKDEARTINTYKTTGATAANTKLYGIYAFGTEADYLDDLLYYSQNNSHRPTSAGGVTDATVNTPNYFKADTASDLETAIRTIFTDIANTLGVQQVAMHDGTTNEVSVSSGSMNAEGMVNMVPGSFKYYLTIKVSGNGPYTFKKTDPLTGEELNITVTDKGNDKYDLTWTTAAGNSHSVTDLVGNVSGGLTKEFTFEWTGSNEFYPLTGGVPEATYNNGAVNWDLSSVGTLLNGVKYTVTFNLYPTQSLLDLVADYRNGLIEYGKTTYKDGSKTVNPKVWDYLTSDMQLKTNTDQEDPSHAYVSYNDTRDNLGVRTEEYDPQDPIGVVAVEEMAVTKEWPNNVDQRPHDDSMTLGINRDNASYIDLVLGESNHWQKAVNASVGMLTIHDGNVSVLASGHDYSFSEDVNLTHHWELSAPTIHPMIVNGTPTMLVLVTEDGMVNVPAALKDSTKANDVSGDYYKLTVNGTTKYYKVDNAVANLTAYNYRRSVLDVKKVVTGKSAPEDSKFLFTFKVNDSSITTPSANGQDIWFSVHDEDNIPIFDLTVTNATAEGYRDVDTNDTDHISNVTINGNLLSYKYDGGELNTVLILETLSEGVYRCNPGFYYARSDSEFTVEMKAGYDLRVINLPTGSTYTVTETSSTPSDGYNLVSVVNEKGKKSTDKTYSGTVETANTAYTVTYTNEYTLTSVPVTKVWDDNSNQDGIRPDEEGITLKLTGGASDITKTITKNDVVVSEDGNSWTYTFKDLPAKDADGNEYNYKVDEVSVPDGYSKVGTVTGDALTGYTITNKHEISKITSITAKKVWNDDNNQDGLRTAVSISLYANGNKVASVLVDGTKDTATTGNRETAAWVATFYNLDEYADGTEITYSVDEDAVPTGYTKGTISGNKTTGFEIQNNHTSATTTLDITKIWDDKDDQDGKRPDDIEITLLDVTDRNNKITVKTETLTIASDNANVTIDEDGNWKYTFTDLAKYKDGGTEIKYDVLETAIDEYNVDNNGEPAYQCLTDKENKITGYIITNTHEISKITSITAKKVWNDDNNQDGLRTAVSISLYANGNKVASVLVDGTKDTATTGNRETAAWVATFYNLDEYADGTEITYSVDEDAVPTGYTKGTISGNKTTGFEIQNNHTSATKDVTVTKVWEDDSNRDGLRPDNITLILKADGTEVDRIELNAKNGDTQSYTFPNMPVNDKGTRIVYTADEASVPTGYTKDTNDKDLSVTNSYSIKTKNITVKKVWDDASNSDGQRPETGATIHLLDGTTPIEGKSVTLKPGESGVIVSQDGNTLSYTFINVPVYKDGGTEIKYGIKEDRVSGYNEPLYSSADNGNTLIVTNPYTTDTVDITVTKVWADGSDRDGLRPETVTLLVLDGTVEVDRHTINAKNGDEMSWTFQGLPKYKNGGTPITYKVDEVAVDGYGKDIDNDNYIITNSKDYETINIPFTKEWKDENDQDGLRPTCEEGGITVNLLDGTTVVATQTVCGDGDTWSGSFDKMPKYKNHGEKITYTLQEVGVKGYTSAVSGNVITNTHTPELISVEGSKVWADAENIEGFRPIDDGITVKLYADGTEIDSQIVKGTGDEWAYSFSKLPKYKDHGKEIKYTVSEDPVENYEEPDYISATGDENKKYVIVNTHNPKNVTITAKKVWKDTSETGETNIYGHPDTVDIILTGSVGEETIVSEPWTLSSEEVDDDGNWTHTFTDLPEYRNGMLVTYMVDEVPSVKDYHKDVTPETKDGVTTFTVTNTYEIEDYTVISGSKTWNDDDDRDGLRPDAITIKVTDQFGNVVVSKDVTEEDNWEYEIKLPKYGYSETEEDFVELTYEVTEVGVDGYETKVSGYNVTNTHEIATVSYHITKVWTDNTDNDGLRPEEITVHIIDEDTEEEYGTAIMSAENKWYYEFDNLPKYKNGGEEIKYKIIEDPVAGYTYTFRPTEENNGVDYILENTHEDSLIDIIIKKIWDDNDDVSQIRPNEIIVDLLIDNEVVDTLTITSEDGWEGAFTNLNEFDGGVKIEYVVREREIPEYETSYSVDGNTYTITNHHELGKGNGPEEEPPQTGIIYNKRGVFIVLMNMFGLSFAVRRTKED